MAGILLFFATGGEIVSNQGLVVVHRIELRGQSLFPSIQRIQGRRLREVEVRYLFGRSVAQQRVNKAAERAVQVLLTAA